MPMGQADDTRKSRNGWIIICDGRKAIIAENTGTLPRPSLRVAETLNAPPNPSTRDLGDDRPGRTAQAIGGRRSSVEMTDLHEQGERAFLVNAARRFAEIALQQRARSLVVVAPPKALPVIREHLGPAARDLVVDEIAKDLTKHPMDDIERLLVQG